MNVHKFGWLWLVVLTALYGCATTAPPPRPPLKTMSQVKMEDFKRHFASLDVWIKGLNESRECDTLLKTDTDRQKYYSCLESLSPPDTYIPKDRKKDESVFEYMDRKTDEWDEKECFYKGVTESRYLGERTRIQDQCMQTLEIKRLRKVLEKQQELRK